MKGVRVEDTREKLMKIGVSNELYTPSHNTSIPEKRKSRFRSPRQVRTIRITPKQRWTLPGATTSMSSPSQAIRIWLNPSCRKNVGEEKQVANVKEGAVYIYLAAQVLC